ncbi:Cell morphoproteinsis protein PAG1 [Haplosporangium bisporale]|nr:Cell morphoproteinsis protein PAG1 [Haplosporangium bisporale]
MLFTQFVKMAETKLNTAIHLPLQDSEPDILSPLKHGADPKFDKLLASLGSVARHRPKPVIDCVMLWRKGKIESPDDATIKSASGEWSVNFKFRDPKAVIKERKSVVSLFIMSRSLIEIVSQVQKDTLPDELGSRLEETVFSQLENVDPEFIQRSANRTANMNALVELMGSLSNVRFATVSDRFIAELEKYKVGASVKDKDRELRMEMLIRGMRYLNLKLYPENCLEETADFLQSCAGFFKMARGIRIKHAYAELFVQLLTPVAKVALAEVNHPNWSKTVELIYPKARKMTNKPRHVQVAFPLVTILLCVSKKDFFLKHWLSVFDSLREKFKDKIMRHIALNCATQLVWVFIFRCSDASASTFRSLDAVAKAIFPSSRKSGALLDGSLGHFVRILRFMGTQHADYTTRSIIFPLLNLESLSNVIFTNLTMDMISPERMTIGVRSFMLILADMEQGGNFRPPFPTSVDVIAGANELAAPSDILEPSIINRAGMRDSYDQLSAVLGKIAIVCDRNYGHTLILDEKYTTARSMFSAAAIMATATGDGGASIVHQYSTFAVSFSKEKQIYFDLMTAWVTCLPRCMPSGIPLVKLVEMLSRYTAHVDPELRKASAAALVRIAKQCNAQVVVAGYSAFVCTVEDRLSELLAGLAAPGPGTLMETGLLGIYIQILEAWIQDTRSKNLSEAQAASEEQAQISSGALASPAASAEGSRSFTTYGPEVSLQSQLQTTEENGLLFLCSPSPTIRRYAITILSLAASFDRPESGNNATNENKEPAMSASASIRPRMEITRVYHLLQNAAQELLQVDEYGNALKDCPLAIMELIRLQIHHQKGSSEVFSLLAGSDHAIDGTIWRRCFPLLISKIFQLFPGLCEPCLETVGRRLMQLYPAIVTTTDLALNSTLASKFSIKTTQVATDEMVEQWRTYLIFVCSTMVRHEHPSPAAPGHGRKKSAPSEKITCARDLFRLIVPLLNSDRHLIRESVVASLGRINAHLYKALLEDLLEDPQPVLYSAHDEFRSKNSSIKPPYQGRRKKMDRLRAEIAHILDLTAPLLRTPSLIHDEHITSCLRKYVRETLIFLLDSEVQHEWEFVKLRTHFCGFVCHLHNSVSQIGNTESIVPFDVRLALFRLFEDWCGHGPNSFARDSENKCFWFGLDFANEMQMAEKFNLELAALRAMASLCQGPIAPSQRPDRARTSFNIEEVFRWVESVFRSPDEKLHPIAQNALEALLIHNQDRSELLEDALHQCYAGDMSQKFIQGHFTALVDIILRIESYPCQVHQMLSLALFKCGDLNIQIRTLAIKLLKVIEARYFPEPCAGEYEIGIVNKLPTIYRQAQYVLSARLAQDRPEQTYSLLSEAMMRFDLVRSVWQGEMLYYIAPWLGNVELVVDEDDELSMTSFVVLTNLFYLTVKYGDDHVKEVEDLWVQLVAGDNFANIRPILVFLLDLGLEKRNPEFVHPAKKVIVFLGRTSACSRMVDILISEISPKAMVPKLRQERNHARSPFLTDFYLANLDSLMNGREKRPAFSRGQLATVLLVDLAVEAGAELRRHLPLLLQALFVQLDHYTALICDQTRSLLVHLIHSIIIRESRSLEVIDQSTDLVDFLNTKEGKPLWAYDDIINYNMRDSPELETLVYRSIQVFQASEVEIRQQWGETALQWATACPVRHVACRSFQIFRALSPCFNQHMLADMLARLSNTIGDKSQEIQAFAMEILISLQSVIEGFDSARMMQFPQIFWGSIACLYTGHDQEYLEGLKILETVTNRLDIMDGPTLEFLLSYFPEQWDSAFMGIQPLLLKGLRSSMTEQISLRLLRKIMFVSENALIDPSDYRVVFLFMGLLAEHEMMHLGYPMMGPNSTVDFVDQDGMPIGVDPNGPTYGVGVEREDLHGSQVQYGHLVSALDDLTEHFAESARFGDARKRESVALASQLYSDPSLQGQWNAARPGQGQDGALGESSSKLGMHNNDSQPTLGSSLFNRGHQRGSRAHGSKGSRDEFGNLYSIPHHDRIVEDDEEESTLMAAEILNKSLSINRSYSSIRSSFLMEPASYNIGISGQDDDASGGQSLTGVGSRLGSPVPGLGGGSGGGQPSSSNSGVRGGQHNSSPMSGSNRVRLYGPGQGHRGHRSSGSGSGGGSLLARGNNHSANHVNQQGHRTASSNAGSNSSSIIITPGGWSGTGAGNSGTGSGHRAKASYDDLSLSSSDDDDDDDDSTDSDDEDYQSGGRYEGQMRTRENSYERFDSSMIHGRLSTDTPVSSPAARGGNQLRQPQQQQQQQQLQQQQQQQQQQFASGHSPSNSRPGSRTGSRPGSRSSSRPGSTPASPASKRVMERITSKLGQPGGDLVTAPNVHLAQK